MQQANNKVEKIIHSRVIRDTKDWLWEMRRKGYSLRGGLGWSAENIKTIAELFHYFTLYADKTIGFGAPDSAYKYKRSTIEELKTYTDIPSMSAEDVLAWLKKYHRSDELMGVFGYISLQRIFEVYSAKDITELIAIAADKSDFKNTDSSALSAESVICWLRNKMMADELRDYFGTAWLLLIFDNYSVEEILGAIEKSLEYKNTAANR